MLVRQSLHCISLNLVEVEPLSLEQLKARVCAALQANPDDWRDDEAIAGEDGPRRDEQDLLKEMKSAVNSAATLPQLINVLWDEDLPG